MKEQIKIKGEPVDLGDANITLNFKSNILSDISKITASNSYTIELPNTIRNARLLDSPDILAHKSYMMRDYFDAEYWRNGIKIFDCKAVIMGVSSSGFSLSLTWDLLKGIGDIKNDDKTIQDFAKVALPWGKSTTYELGMLNKHAFIYHNSGIDVDSMREKVFVHPSAHLYTILQRISENYGISFSFPALAESYLKRLFVPCTTKNSDPDLNFVEGNVIFKDNYVQSLDQTNRTEKMMISGSLITLNGAGVYKITSTLKLSTSSGGEFVGVNSSKGAINNFYYEIGDDGFYHLEEIVEIEEDDTYTVVIYTQYETTPLNGRENFLKVQNLEINEDVMYGTVFPVGKNIPAIKVVDFLKQIGWLFGLSAIPSNDGVLFLSFDDLLNNKNNAIDWSGKLLSNGSRPVEINYTFGDFAQKNWFRYKDNEDSPNVDGFMAVNNKTLEKEKDLIVLPYKAGNDNEVMNIVPYYKLSDKGEIELVDCGERIMTWQASREFDGNELVFNDYLNANYILNNYFSGYQKIIHEPIIIKDYFKLDEIDLKSIDYTRPVYIEQYGAFFAIISIQVQGERSTCELLKV